LKGVRGMLKFKDLKIKDLRFKKNKDERDY